MFGTDITVQELPLFVLFCSMVIKRFEQSAMESHFLIEVQSKELEIFISICRLFPAEIMDIRKYVIFVILY